jgi:clan AA aspartic protease (TIGR02281 family)
MSGARIPRLFCVTAALLALLALVRVIAAPAAEVTPEEVLKGKGLTKVGTMYVLDADVRLSEGLRDMRRAKHQVDEVAAKRAKLDQQIRQAKDAITELNVQLRDANERLDRANKSDVNGYNRIIGQIDKIKTSIVDAATFGEAREAELGKLSDPRDEYVGAVTNVSDTMEALANQYEELGKDAEVKAALERINAKATPKVRLGPSTVFTQELAGVRQLRVLVNKGVIKLRVKNGVAEVDVVLNGSLSRPMLVDSGASMVLIKGETCRRLGISPSYRDEMVKMTVADGRKVDCRVAMLKSVRVAQFTVQDVPCLVLPDGIDSEELLGGTFLRNFAFKIDFLAQELQLSQIMGGAKGAAGDAKPAPATNASARWTVLFRSDDPSMWNHARGRSSDRNGYAADVNAAAPEETRFLRIRRTDSGEAVITNLHKDALLTSTETWIGSAWVGYGGTHLGIKNPAWKKLEKGLVDIDANYQGWGFGHVMYAAPGATMGYAWAGATIPTKMIFEIAVTSDELSAAERQLLVGAPELPETGNASREDMRAHLQRLKTEGRKTHPTGLLILEARWGGMAKWRDVTPLLQSAVKGDTLEFPVSARVLGEPPAGGRRELIVSQDDGEQPFTYIAYENEVLRVSVPPSNEELRKLVEATIPPARRGALAILYASYGAGAFWNDVRPLLQKAMNKDGLRLKVGEGWQDPAPKMDKKTLRLVYWDGAEIKQIRLAQHADLDLAPRGTGGGGAANAPAAAGAKPADPPKSLPQRLAEARKRHPEGLVIAQALWGGQDEWKDVTDVLQAAVTCDTLGFTITPAVFGDAGSGIGKQLSASYFDGEQIVSIEMPGLGEIRVSAIPSKGELQKRVEAFKNSAGGGGASGLAVLDAWYGADGRWVDVRDALQKRVGNDGLEATVGEGWPDPAFGAEKQLRLVYWDGAEVKTARLKDGAALRLRSHSNRP